MPESLSSMVTFDGPDALLLNGRRYVLEPERQAEAFAAMERRAIEAETLAAQYESELKRCENSLAELHRDVARLQIDVKDANSARREAAGTADRLEDQLARITNTLAVQTVYGYRGGDVQQFLAAHAERLRAAEKTETGLRSAYQRSIGALLALGREDVVWSLQDFPL